MVVIYLVMVVIYLVFNILGVTLRISKVRQLRYKHVGPDSHIYFKKKKKNKDSRKKKAVHLPKNERN